MSNCDELKEEIEKEEMKPAWSKLSNAINSFSYDEQAEAFYKGLSYQHRTLQQNFWRLIIEVVRNMLNSTKMVGMI